MGRIEFEGNDLTNDKVLRRELRLYEGGLMSLTALRNSVLKVNQLGYFKLNEEDPVEIDTDSESKKVDILFHGDEALFADAGNVYGEDQPFNLSNLRTTAGVELRVLLPVFGAPLRFIYAKNLDPRPQDDFEELKFSIGTSF